MWKALLDTRNDWTLATLRIVLGVVMLPHGAQKLLGWFGGFGFQGTMGYFTGTLGLPAVLGVLVIFLEFFGGLALILGVGSRVAAAGVAAIMAGAVALVHLPNGFFMNWSGNQAGEGFEYHLLAIAIALAVAVKGAGALSLDRWLAGIRVAVREEFTAGGSRAVAEQRR